LRLLALSAAQFEAFLWRQQCMAEAQQKLMLRETLELLDTSQQGASAGTMGAIMCNELQAPLQLHAGVHRPGAAGLHPPGRGDGG